ncbi:hypothetical protein TNCT_273081 [Trichonephila clavata]|uniref:Uncharacterized protein n=1 Tax=Trichonephila clavata TaxID=2740835 RepID=A0A8X6GD30_TRICU|nr:hypothetical protein TNCT_273081 [Trichonephila clavata]
MTSFPRPSRLPYLNPRAYLRYGVERDVQCEMWETVEKAGLTSINQQQQDHVFTCSFIPDEMKYICIQYCSKNYNPKEEVAV